MGSELLVLEDGRFILYYMAGPMHNAGDKIGELVSIAQADGDGCSCCHPSVPNPWLVREPRGPL